MKVFYSLTIMISLFIFTACSKQELNLNQISSTQPDDSLYLKGTVKKGLILLHGQGKNPDWKVVNPLRINIHNELSYHTLSLQMPNNRDYWKDYTDDFPKAYEIIKQAIVFLKSKGVNEIYIMGHSMGSRMASSFLSQYANIPINGFIAVGCRNNGGSPLSCIDNVSNIKDIPILDIWGGDNKKDIKSAKQREYLISNRYKQISIDDANHKLDGYDDEFKIIVIEWLKSH